MTRSGYTERMPFSSPSLSTPALIDRAVDEALPSQAHSSVCACVSCTCYASGFPVRWNLQKSLFSCPCLPECGGEYRCNVQGCKFRSHHWDCLLLHCSSKHCKNPQRFYCSEAGCKYSSGLGFTRRDKLKSHYENVHEGRRFTQPVRALRPAPPRN